jgi:DNA-3-methyladenine glycosylase
VNNVVGRVTGTDALPDMSAPVLSVADQLLGCVLACRGSAGVIVETEAYHQDEPACHAYRGRTPRTDPLFGQAGTAYVYFTYGMHWCANLVCEEEGIGAAVLIRALAPVHGLDIMHARRENERRRTPIADRDLCNGPAKLVQALGIVSTDNCHWMLSHAQTLDDLLLEATDGPRIAALPEIAREAGIDSSAEIAATPRIGISQAVDLPWRRVIRGSQWLSRAQ